MHPLLIWFEHKAFCLSADNGLAVEVSQPDGVAVQ